MRIGIDARFYGPRGKGLGRYTEKLIKNLEKVDRKNQYVIFLRQENLDEYIPENGNFKKVVADLKWYSLDEQLKMPKLIKEHKIDLMHFPHFNVPVLYRGDFIVTIHDLILLRFPTKRATTLGPLLYKFKYLAYKLAINSAVRRAKKVITVSEFTKSDLVNYFKIKSDKVEVTYEACDGVESGQLSIPEAGFLEKNKINKPYILYVGNAYPHKNLEGLIDAYKNFKEKNGYTHQLVLIGKEDYFYRRLKQDAYSTGLLYDNSVVFFGFASQKDLAYLYSRASLYVFPSFIEGFGLPGLEAMSFNLPVISSNTSSLPEILGRAAIYFDPRDRKDMVLKIEKVLNDKDLQVEMKRRGHEQVRKFNWTRCALETLQVYESVK
jgi:glycosyltransferase involved in cell wall biosynthesis